MSVDITFGSITLPDGMIFENEFADNAAAAEDVRAITGKLVRQTGVKDGGRPIRLVGGWTTRATVIALKVLQDAGTTATLTLHDGTAFSVKIESIEADPVIPYQEPVAADYYELAINFTEMAS